ncbi:hypothetical protein, partial [Achromobacter ruhlandii]|uniref:hypothetical protein n=1 Tax=Achromobacter ruhlandii TaxID=72557 RepID=UPI000B314718
MSDKAAQGGLVRQSLQRLAQLRLQRRGGGGAGFSGDVGLRVGQPPHQVTIRPQAGLFDDARDHVVPRITRLLEASHEVLECLDVGTW